MVDPKKVKEDVETAVTAELLERHGKLWAARYLRSQPPSCRPQLLRQLLGRVLSPLKPITDESTVDWLRWLMSGEHSPEAFAEQVRQYDNAQRCGMVWTADFVAYRCRTCSVSPCMSLCAECFQRGNHEGHDYNMFRSQAGGACDCGDPYVMKETGFCSLHGQLDPSQQRRPPDSLMEIPRLMLPFIFRRLLIYLRMNSRLMDETSSDSLSSLMSRLDVFLSYLQELCSMRAAMRSSMTNVLICRQLYLEMDSESVSLDDPHLTSDTTKLVQEAYRNYLEAVNNMPNPDLPAHLRVLSPALGDQIRHCSMLDELVFWTYKYEFPTKLVCFLLNMLPEQKYKECFASAFVVHYARISQMLAASNDPDPLTNRVVHVSVQLFSNELLAVRMTEDMHLLHAMIVSLTYMTGRILVNCQLHDSNRNTHMVANCADKIMKNHCYWPLVSDLSNVLGHKPVSLYFLADDQLLHMWFSYLSMYQGMNVNFRQLDTHVDMEPSTYYAAFSAELEGSATPMWALLAHLREPGAATLSKRLLRHAYAALQKWHDNIGCPQTYEEILADTSTDLRCSFHLPLHRYVALIISEAAKRQSLSLQQLLPSETMMVTLVSHLLRLQVSFHEICAGLWVRNGNQMRGQTMTYTQCHFCCSMVDPDIYLLQLGATMLDPDKFLTLVLKKFHVWEWLSFAPNASSSFLESDQEIPMVEACLTFLATLLCVRTCGGISEEEIARLEIATQLCMGDKTHSQLTELLPEKSETVNSPPLFETALAQVSRYRGPASEASGNMQQGIYGPKPEVWHSLYDPIYVMLRAMVRKEFQTSMDRFTAFVKSTGQYTDSRTSPWPPYRLPPRPPAPPSPPSSPSDCKASESAAAADGSSRVPDVRRLLGCSTFYGVLMAVLRRCVQESTVSEQLMALTVFLLEMAVREPERPPTGQEMYCSTVADRDDCTDLCFSEWFATPRSSDNLRRVIDNITVPHTANPSLWPANSTADNSEVLIESMSVADDIESHPDSLYSCMPPPAPLPAIPPSSNNNNTVSNRSSVSEAMDTSLDVVPLSSAPTGPDGPLLTLRSLAVMPALAVMAGSEVARVPSLPAPQSQGGRGNRQGDVIDRSLPPSMLSLVSYDTDMTVANTSIGSLPAGFADDAEVAELDWYNGDAAVVAGDDVDDDDGNEMVPTLPAPPGAGGRNRPAARTSVAFGESIVSLLLKLHSKLSDQSDSYRLPSDAELETMTESRVGNGSFFVGQLLSFIAKKDPLLKQHIVETQSRLWPKAEEEDTTKVEDREARRRMARERQQRLMRQFAHKQRQFQQQMETESGGTAGASVGGASASSSTASPSARAPLREEYDCVICGQSSGGGGGSVAGAGCESEQRRPFGLVVLLQASSVLAHQRVSRQRLQLPVDENGCSQLRQQLAANRAGFVEMVHERLANTFDDKSWLLTMNIGVSGGVHVQTCGHHLHLDCHRLYISSLSGHEARQQGVSLQRGEFSCPLCRQQCNCVLPLLDSAVDASSSSLHCHDRLQQQYQQQQNRQDQPMDYSPDLYGWIHDKLAGAAPNEYDQNFWEPISKAMESMTHVTYPRYRNTTPQSPGHENVLLFVASIARTNLEMEVVQRGGRLVGTGNAAAQLVPGVKRSSLRPLLTVLGFNAKMLSVRLLNRYLPAAWMRLNGLDTGSYDAVTLYQPEVPMLARDPCALLILLVLTLPWPPSPPVFTCIVRSLYNLAAVQACTALSLQLSHRQRVQCLLAYVMLSNREHSQNNITWLLGTVLDCLHNVPGLYTDDSCDISGATAHTATEPCIGGAEGPSSEPCADPASLEADLIERCLPFVRVAAVLQQHLWQRPLPALPATADTAAEMSALCQYLSLPHGATCCDRLYWPQTATTTQQQAAKSSETASLAAPSGGNSVALARVWCEQFRSVALQWQYTARDLLRQPRWYQPRLLHLPHQYKHIFLFYHRRECERCGTVPKEPTVCLVCGTLVCLRGQCCKQQHANETVVHSVQCGAGTSVFLAIDSCMVIVIRGRRACLWGSVYLDSFGEEDRELKRGRPLFLCQERYDLLQNLWVAHAFDNTRRRWIWHKEML